MLFLYHYSPYNAAIMDSDLQKELDDAVEADIDSGMLAPEQYALEIPTDSSGADVLQTKISSSQQTEVVEDIPDELADELPDELPYPPTKRNKRHCLKSPRLQRL